MITEQKIMAVKKQLRKGIPAGEMKTQLTNEGYSKEDIDKCFDVKQFDMRSWYLIFAMIFLIIGCYGFYRNDGLLFLIFSAAMFVQYYLADKKKKNA